MVQWLRHCAPNAGGMGLIPSQGAKTLHTTQQGQKKKKRIENYRKQSLLHTYQGDKTYYLEGGITEDKQTLPGVIVQNDFSEDK